MEFSGTETGSINPEAWPRNMRGVGTHWIDHCLIAAEDPGLIERFFQECLDFRTAEKVVETMEHPEVIGTWMTAPESHSAHDLAVIKGPNAKLHHFAYHLDDWNAILRAADIFSMDDVPIDIGPTRHGITRGTTIYFFDPSGNRNEVFAGLELPGAEGLPDDQLDGGPARQGHLLSRTANSTSGSPRYSRRTPPRYEQRFICEHRCRADSSRAAVGAACRSVRLTRSPAPPLQEAHMTRAWFITEISTGTAR